MKNLRLDELLLMAKVDTITEAEKLELIDLLGKIEVKIAPKQKVRMICCPFHEEKTPSCLVNFTTNKIHCFGCGVTGAMEFDHHS